MVVTFTSNPIYWRPLVPRINIKSLDGGTTYYTYDPWIDTGTTTKAVACSVNLSQNHQGVFTLVIEDETNLISSNVNLGARVIIECGKQSTQMTRLISGLIRQKGYSRGGDRKRLITLTGSSTAIRLNEKILYYVNEATKLTQDGMTININDVTRKADLLLQNGLASIILGNPLSTEGILSTGNISTSSDVENLVLSLAIEFGEAQDLCNTLEEQTNGEIFVDTSDVVQFRHQLQPPVAGKGFAIKNKKTSDDNADDTMYLRGKGWDYTASCLKSDGYSNRIYGLLPAEQGPSTREEMGFLSAYSSQYAVINRDSGREWAQKFRPTHSHFRPGDVYVCIAQVGGPTTIIPAVRPKFRICTDNAGVPTNLGGVVANIEYDSSPWGTDDIPAALVNETFEVANQQIFYNPSMVQIDEFYLDTAKDYWLIMSNDNLLKVGAEFGSLYWQFSNITTGTGVYTTTGLSTNTDGGTGWISSLAFNGTQVTFAFALPRLRSEAFEIADSKAVIWLGSGLTTGGNLIESMLPSVPATIKTRQAMYRYLANQIYYMARPRINWNMATVTAPNVPVLPGDPIMISDSVLGFSAAGQQAVMTTCGDMTYSWQIGDYQAPTILNIQPVGNPTFYK